MSSSVQFSDEIGLLEAVPAFELFERDALQIIAFSSDVRHVRAGETLFRRGQMSDCGFLVLSGAVTLDAGEPAPGGVAIFARGALLGSNALFAPTERPATATMREDGRVMRVSRSLVLRVLETFPETARRLRDRLAGETNDTIAAFGRVMSVLNRGYLADAAA
jgi:CRP-like cAMP-binding protein